MAGGVTIDPQVGVPGPVPIGGLTPDEKAELIALFVETGWSVLATEPDGSVVLHKSGGPAVHNVA